MKLKHKIKCGIDPSVEEYSKCAWCCVYCKEKDCEYRCPKSIGCETDGEVNCEYV